MANEFDFVFQQPKATPISNNTSSNEFDFVFQTQAPSDVGTGSTLSTDKEGLIRKRDAKRLFGNLTAIPQALFTRRLPAEMKEDPNPLARINEIVTTPIGIWQQGMDILHGKTPTNLYGEELVKPGDFFYQKKGAIPKFDTGAFPKVIASGFNRLTELNKQKLDPNYKAKTYMQLLADSMGSGQVADLAGSVYNQQLTTSQMANKELKKITGKEIPEWVLKANAAQSYLPTMFAENMIDPAEWIEDIVGDTVVDMAREAGKGSKFLRKLEADRISKKTSIDELLYNFREARKSGDLAAAKGIHKRIKELNTQKKAMGLTGELKYEKMKGWMGPKKPEVKVEVEEPPSKKALIKNAQILNTVTPSDVPVTPASLPAPKTVMDLSVGKTPKGGVKFPLEAEQTLKNAGVEFKKSAAKNPTFIVKGTKENLDKLGRFTAEVDVIEQPPQIFTPPPPPGSINPPPEPPATTINMNPPGFVPEADAELLARGMDVKRPGAPPPQLTAPREGIEYPFVPEPAPEVPVTPTRINMNPPESTPTGDAKLLTQGMNIEKKAIPELEDTIARAEQMIADPAIPDAQKPALQAILDDLKAQRKAPVPVTPEAPEAGKGTGFDTMIQRVNDAKNPKELDDVYAQAEKMGLTEDDNFNSAVMQKSDDFEDARLAGKAGSNVNEADGEWEAKVTPENRRESIESAKERGRKFKDKYNKQLEIDKEVELENEWRYQKTFQEADEDGDFESLLSKKDKKQLHKSMVEDALKSGKKVPPEVLAEYPDLAKKYGKVPEAPAGKAPETGKGTDIEAQVRFVLENNTFSKSDIEYYQGKSAKERNPHGIDKNIWETISSEYEVVPINKNKGIYGFEKRKTPDPPDTPIQSQARTLKATWDRITNPGLKKFADEQMAKFKKMGNDAKNKRLGEFQRGMEELEGLQAKIVSGEDIKVTTKTSAHHQAIIDAGYVEKDGVYVKAPAGKAPAGAEVPTLEYKRQPEKPKKKTTTLKEEDRVSWKEKGGKTQTGTVVRKAKGGYIVAPDKTGKQGKFTTINEQKIQGKYLTKLDPEMEEIKQMGFDTEEDGMPVKKDDGDFNARDTAEDVEEKLTKFFGGEKNKHATKKVTIGDKNFGAEIIRKDPTTGKTKTLPAPPSNKIAQALAGLKAVKPDLDLRVDGKKVEAGDPLDFLRFVGKTLGVTDIDVDQKKMYKWANLEDDAYRPFGKNAKKYMESDVEEAYDVYQKFLKRQEELGKAPAGADAGEYKAPLPEPTKPKKRRSVTLSMMGAGEFDETYKKGKKLVSDLFENVKATIEDTKVPGAVRQSQTWDRIIRFIGNSGEGWAQALNLPADTPLRRIEGMLHKNVFSGMAPKDADNILKNISDNIHLKISEKLPLFYDLFGAPKGSAIWQPFVNVGGTKIKTETSEKVADILAHDSGLWVLKGKKADANMTGKEYHFLLKMVENGKPFSISKDNKLPAKVVDDWVARGLVQPKGKKKYIPTKKAEDIINEINRTPLKDFNYGTNQQNFKKALQAQGIKATDEEFDLAWKLRQYYNQSVLELADVPGAVSIDMKDEITRFHGRYFRKNRSLLGSDAELRKAMSDPTIKADKELIAGLASDDPEKFQAVMNKKQVEFEESILGAQDMGKGNGKKIGKKLAEYANMPGIEKYVSEDDYDRIYTNYKKISMAETAYRRRYEIPNAIYAKIGGGRGNSLKKRTLSASWDDSTEYSKMVVDATKEIAEDTTRRMYFHKALNDLAQLPHIVLPEATVTPKAKQTGTMRINGMSYTKIPDNPEYGVLQGRYLEDHTYRLIKTIGLDKSIDWKTALGRNLRMVWHSSLTNMSGPTYFMRNIATSFKDQWVARGLPLPGKKTLDDNYFKQYNQNYKILNSFERTAEDKVKMKEWIEAGLLGEENLSTVNNPLAFLSQRETTPVGRTLDRIKVLFTRTAAWANMQDRAARVSMYELSKKTMSPEEASELAQIVIPSYRRSTGATKLINSVMPFASWSLKKSRELPFQAGKAMKGNKDALKALIAIPLITGGIAAYQAAKNPAEVARRQQQKPDYERYWWAKRAVNSVDDEKAVALAVAEHLFDKITGQEIDISVGGDRRLEVSGSKFGVSPKALPVVGNMQPNEPVVKMAMAILFNVDPEGRKISYLHWAEDPAPYLAAVMSDSPLLKKAVKAYRASVTKEKSPAEAAGQFLNEFLNPKFFKMPTEEEINGQVVKRKKFLKNQVNRLKSEISYRKRTGRRTYDAEVALDRIDRELSILNYLINEEGAAKRP